MAQTKSLVASSIDHINMTVKDLDESVKFYREVFGFEVRKEQPDYDSKIVGNDSIKLCLYEDPSLEIGDGLNHFGFHVENFEEIVERCGALDVPMPYGTVEWEKSESVYIVDPSGYEIELSRVRGGGI